MSVCQLCARNTHDIWNVPLLETPNFVVLPSLGALIEGWLLIVPKQHFVSFGAIPDSLVAELLQLKEATSALLIRAYGTVCAFEHGPSYTGRHVGCGVDHAHIHLVPVGFDLAAAVAPYLPKDAQWAEASLVDCKRAYVQRLDYLYFEQPIGRGRLIRDGRLGSQVFRKAIANKLGIYEQFNWRTHSQLLNINNTIQLLRTQALDSPMHEYAHDGAW
jgi:ATP adenylyltransferase